MDLESSVDDNTPLWKYVTRLGIKPCKGLKQEHKLEMKRVIKQVELRMKAKTGKNLSLPTPTSTATTKVAKKRR